MQRFLDPAGEGCSSQSDLHTTVDIEFKIEGDDEDPTDDNFNTNDLLELAEGTVQMNHEPIEFNSTDAIEDRKTGLMVCLHCLERLERDMLYDHMVNAHNYRRVFYKCNICNSIFKERCIMVDHRKDCKPTIKKKSRRSMTQLLKEVDAIMSEDFFERGSCPVCMIELPKSELKDHLLTQHDKNESVACEKCHRTFKSKFTLREHVKLVHLAVENSEQCDLCGQKFRSLKYLSNHKRNVHPSGDKEHKCNVCAKVFKSRLCLHQHNKCVHPPETESVKCPKCPKVFKSKLNLQQHLKVSHRVKK